ncbi:MAG: hypothetical protein ACE5KZ_06715 [Candidatus Scalinduaceae bacterium]
MHKLNRITKSILLPTILGFFMIGNISCSSYQQSSPVLEDVDYKSPDSETPKDNVDAGNVDNRASDNRYGY